jgi:cytochrome P450 family 6
MALLFESVALSLATFLIAVFTGMYLYFTRNFNFWKKRGIPYLKPTPFLGNIKELVFQKVGIGHHLQKIYDENKDVPYVGFFSFDQPSLLIRDLDLVKNILVKDSQHFMDRVITFNEVLDPFFGKTMFTLKGQRWRHVRVNLTPVFTSGKMKKMFYLVEKCAKELADYLDRATANSKRHNFCNCKPVL